MPIHWSGTIAAVVDVGFEIFALSARPLWFCCSSSCFCFFAFFFLAMGRKLTVSSWRCQIKFLFFFFHYYLQWWYYSCITCDYLNQSRSRLHLFLVLLLSHQYHPWPLRRTPSSRLSFGVIVVSGIANRTAATNYGIDEGIVVVW